MNDLKATVKKFGPKEIELSDSKKYIVEKLVFCSCKMS